MLTPHILIQAQSIHFLKHFDHAGFGLIAPVFPLFFVIEHLIAPPSDPHHWLLVLSSPFQAHTILTLIGMNLKAAWSRYFLEQSTDCLDFFDAKKFGFVPAQLRLGGASVADALRVGFAVEDLRGAGWVAHDVADVVGGAIVGRDAAWPAQHNECFHADSLTGAAMKSAGWSIGEIAELGPAFAREAGNFAAISNPSAFSDC